MSASLSETHDSRVPVTMLTGLLSSEKTTLLNRTLSENHGLRVDNRTSPELEG